MSASSTTPSSWPPGLDALVAAPRHHTLLLENERVRVLDTRVRPGEIVPIHTHRWPSVLHILSFAAFVRRDAEGKVLVDTRTAAASQPPPPVLWSEPLPPHTLENVGQADIHVIAVELKSGGG